MGTAVNALIQKIQNAKVIVAKSVYNGKALKPKVTVKLNGETLKANTDYTIQYANNKKAGQGKVVLKGKGSYAGKKIVMFQILPKKNKITKLTGVKGRKAVVKFSKSTGVKGYEISYTTDKKFKKSVKKVTTAKRSVTLSKLKKNRKYYVRVRAYVKVNGKKIYSDYSSKKAVKIKK